MNYGKFLVLSSDLWGRHIAETDCFKLLDLFYDAGFRAIDTAPDYPVNDDFFYYRKAENILHEWINVNDINDLEIIARVGNINNSEPARKNLTFSFLLMSFDYYLDKFNTNLDVFMIHGDDRSSGKEIEDTVKALKIIREKSGVGLTGIRHPEIYHGIPDAMKLNYTILVNHSIFSSGYQAYYPFHSNSRFIADSGKTGEPENKRKKVDRLINLLEETIDIETPEHLNLLYSFPDPAFSGFIIRPKNNIEMKKTLSFCNEIKNINVEDIHNKIGKYILMSHKHGGK